MNANAAPRSASLSLLGRAFRVTGAPTELARWIDAHWRFDEHALRPVAYDIALDAGSAAPPLARGGEASTRVHGKETLVWHGGGDEWWTGGPDAGVRLECDARSARIASWGWSAPTERLHAALYLALCETLRASGLVSLHAAVVAREGAATALCGRSGVGKSTTLLGALSRGWSALAEDLSWLDVATLTVYGWDRGVRLWPEGQARLAEHAGAAWDTDADGKRFLPYERLGVARTPLATLDRILVLHRDAALESGVRPLAPRAAVRAWWEAVGVPLTTTATKRGVEATAVVRQRVEFAELVLGASPARF